MLLKFEVENFKVFKEKFTFDLSNVKNYEFSPNCIKNDLVNKAIVYGANGCGKSNLGLAIFDMVAHLTDKYVHPKNYLNYLNATLLDNDAKFSYHFKFDDSYLTYTYQKRIYNEVVSERLEINGVEVISYEFGSEIKSNLEGTEGLDKDLKDTKLSAVKYIKKNAVLKENETNRVFESFFNFVENMLFFKSTEEVDFIGLKTGSEFIGNAIVNDGYLEDFEKFLNDAGIECNLSFMEMNGQKNITFKFDDVQLDFWSIASTGTKSLTLFYYWYKNLIKVGTDSLIFIDEFDAFYHHELSWLVVEKLLSLPSQVILTTHDINIMSNDLMRPDCYFVMNKTAINSLPEKTDKELRFAHNLEKMYRAGSFNG